MNTNNLVNTYKNTAYKEITHIQTLTNNIKAGNYKSLEQNLITTNPINAALQAISAYKTAAQQFDKEFDCKIEQQLTIADHALAEMLIEKQADQEIQKVIEMIYKSNEYVTSALKRIVPNSSGNLEIKWTIKPLSTLPNDILLNIFSKSGIEASTKLMQASKFFNDNYSINQDFWKVVLTNEQNYQDLLDIYPDLNKPSRKNWKMICFDMKVNPDRLTSKACYIVRLYNACGINRLKNLFYLDAHKISQNNLNKLIKKHFKLPFMIPEKKLKWDTQKKKVLELANVAPNRIDYTNTNISIEPSNLAMIIGDTSLKLPEKPPEWEILNDTTLDDDNECCKCIMF